MTAIQPQPVTSFSDTDLNTYLASGGIRVHHSRPATRGYTFYPDLRSAWIPWALTKRAALDKIDKIRSFSFKVKRERGGVDEEMKALLEHVARLEVDFDDEETLHGSVSSDRSFTSTLSGTLTDSTAVSASDVKCAHTGRADSDLETKQDAKLLQKKYRSMRNEVIITKVLRTITFDRYQRDRRARLAAYAARIRA